MKPADDFNLKVAPVTHCSLFERSSISSLVVNDDFYGKRDRLHRGTMQKPIACRSLTLIILVTDLSKEKGTPNIFVHVIMLLLAYI